MMRERIQVSSLSLINVLSGGVFHGYTTRTGRSEIADLTPNPHTIDDTFSRRTVSVSQTLWGNLLFPYRMQETEPATEKAFNHFIFSNNNFNIKY